MAEPWASPSLRMYFEYDKSVMRSIVKRLMEDSSKDKDIEDQARDSEET